MVITIALPASAGTPEAIGFVPSHFTCRILFHRLYSVQREDDILARVTSLPGPSK
jgi:hypothetical protein